MIRLISSTRLSEYNHAEDRPAGDKVVRALVAAFIVTLVADIIINLLS